MKVGILTFHMADSYGAVLQAHALQHILETLGADCEFVNIRMPRVSAASSQTYVSPAAAVFARKLQAEGKKRADRFTAFRDTYMKMSQEYMPEDPIDRDYDLFIAGSDQIWNFRIPGADARYFLPFAAPEKRCSYAASFGSDKIPEKAKSWVASQLKQFRSVSVREASGCSIVRELTGKEASVHLDPTLLPGRSYWQSLTSDDQGEDYELLFQLKYDENLYMRAKAHAESNGRKLKVITAAFMPKLGMEAWNSTGVNDWLTAIRHAKCVFTNSFHGMVFSVIFGRRFHIGLLTGELSSRNGRLVNMLNLLGLDTALEEIVEPDDTSVWNCLEEKRQESVNYLRGLINGRII